MEKARNIKLVIFDVDGVMTDGNIIIDENGVQTRNFNIKDGMGVVALQQLGVAVAIITSKKSGAVRKRAQGLNIKHFYEGYKKKTEAYAELIAELQITDEEVCYVGDDLVDLCLLNKVGLPIAVADSVDEALDAAAYVTKRAGGKGAVREVAELILKAQGKWDKLIAKMS